jgi:hypothetical protein
MNAVAVPPSGPTRPRHRRLWVVTVVVVVVAVALLAAIAVPVHAQSKLLTVAPGTSAYVEFQVPPASWVTVHFSHAGGMPMTYWMDGPGGMMFTHRGMMQGDAYSFGTWGGSVRCYAAYDGPASGMSPVWVNATWGLL